MLELERIIPRPIRDLLLGPSCIIEKSSSPHGEDVGEAEDMIKSALRIAITASLVFFVIKSQSSVSVATVLGICLSLPCTLVAGGSYLLYRGIAAVAAALATGSFKSLGPPIASFAAGYCALEWHDILMLNKVGALEWFLISPAAERWGVPLASWFKE